MLAVKRLNVQMSAVKKVYELESLWSKIKQE